MNKTRTLTPGLTHTAIGDLYMIEHELDMRKYVRVRDKIKFRLEKLCGS